MISLTLSSLGYFLGWVIGILALAVTASVITDFVTASIIAYGIKKAYDKYQKTKEDKENGIIDAEVKFTS